MTPVSTMPPVIAITGQVATDFSGTQYHQEVNLEKLFADVAVYSRTVTTEDQVPDVRATNRCLGAQRLARLGSPDRSGHGRPHFAHRGRLPRRGRTDRSGGEGGHPGRDRLRRARDELIAFAEAVKATIVRSLRAKEVIDDGHPLCIGGLGLLGDRPGVKAMGDCDLLLTAGTGFPYHDFYPKEARTIQIDIQPTGQPRPRIYLR